MNFSLLGNFTLFKKVVFFMSEKRYLNTGKIHLFMFEHFAKEKSDFLRKKDKSRKGCIDKDAVKIVNEINSKKGFYTTSSCAGRIVLLEIKSKRKDECNWVFAKHDKVNFNEMNKIIKNYKKNLELPLKAYNKEETSFESSFNSQLWFKQQPLILHVACRNLDAANKLLDMSRKIFRRAGIIGVTNRKVMVEIIGDERLETIIADKIFVADSNYIKQLVKYANVNFAENKKKSERLFKIVKFL